MMTKFILAACLVAVFLGGCATSAPQGGVRPWWTLNERDFAKITPGQSRDDIERALGQPLLVQTFSNLREDVWNYRFADGGVRRFAAEVHFHADDGVKYVVTYLDNCTFAPVGCP
jgi:outer membrane protein assembly factor BamE (lipoprotein component of BamABCDE complex)